MEPAGPIERLTAPDDTKHAVEALVERYGSQADYYASATYNETSTRRDFIDPFFEALGWDVANKQGWAEPYREVIHEDGIRVGREVRAPDYCFRVGGRRMFFVEAKKPSVSVKGDPAPAYQLRRYGWSAHLPLSVLTDFEEFAVYECGQRPSPDEGPSVARVDYIPYIQYLDRIDDIYSVFSKEAICRGAFDRYAEGVKRKRGTQTVDRAFLAEIEAWREVLAKDIARNNPDLSIHDLNAVVQATINRILFLRIAEDRGVERYGRLRDLAGHGGVYADLLGLYQEAEEKYNSGLFDFGCQGDGLSGGLTVSDKVLKPIVGGLYYPDCPYEFSVIGADILGAVYEQFLGKTIRLTAGHRAKVEEKPEVRKAGGVYYTPTYIVDYIVKHTVGELLEEAGTPERALELRILDPACGSGSFLLGAYQYLLDWHLRYYVAHDPEKRAKERNARVVPSPTGDWRLSLAARKEILTRCIYGVDLDRQAVEVAKLNLLLKCMEGETEQTVGAQLRLFHERVLPNIDANIKCGNSLIGPDYWEGRQGSMFDEDEARRVNPFDWESGFPEVMKRGGFDAVIGNPPYVRIQTLREMSPTQPDYFRRRFRTARGSYDLYAVFIERGIGLMRARGRLGFIVPNKLLTTDYGAPLRRQIAEQSCLTRLVDFGHAQVFEQATTYTCLLFLANESRAQFEFAAPPPGEMAAGEPPTTHFEAAVLQASDTWLLGTQAEMSLARRLAERGVRLADLPCEISRGTSTGADAVFMLRAEGEDELKTRGGDPVVVEAALLRTPIFASDFARYRFAPSSGEKLLFPYEVGETEYRVLAEPELRSRFPAAHAYLRGRRAELGARKTHGPWYGFSAPRNLATHQRAQLLVPLLANRGLFAPMPQAGPAYCLMASGGFSLAFPSLVVAVEYVLGLLNSRLLFWQLARSSNCFRGGWITCTKQYVNELPIRPIDFDNPDDVAKHDRMVSLVDTMLELHKRLPEAKTAHDRELIQRQIDATDRQIDHLVYDLYGLTDEEIAIVEEAT